MEKEESTDTWQQMDPFEALSSGKLTLEATIINRKYDSDVRYRIMSTIGGFVAFIVLGLIGSYFVTYWNGTWFIIPGIFILMEVISGLLSLKYDRYEETGHLVFHDQYAIIMDNDRTETNRILYSEIRSITAGNLYLLGTNQFKNSRHLASIPIRIGLLGRASHKLELKTNLNNYTEERIRVNFEPTLEEVMIWLYPSYIHADKSRKRVRYRFLSNKEY